MILTGGIDLSVGSLMAICSVVCAMLLTVPGWTRRPRDGVPAVALVGARSSAPWPPASCSPDAAQGAAAASSGRETGLGAFMGWRRPAAVGAVLAALALWYLVPADADRSSACSACSWWRPASACCSARINGLIIVAGRLQPFIVTLAMMVTALGIARLTAGQNNAVLPVYTGSNATADVRRPALAGGRHHPDAGPVLPRCDRHLRRGAAVHAVRPLRLRDRRQ